MNTLLVTRIMNFVDYTNKNCNCRDTINKIKDNNNGTITVVFKGHYGENFPLIFSLNENELVIKNENGQSIFDFLGYLDEDTIKLLKFGE